MQPIGRSSFAPLFMQTVRIYKALQISKRQALLREGFRSIDFPFNPPYQDGSCYFAGPEDRSIAEEFNQSYRGGILEVAIDRPAYEEHFKLLEYCYDVRDGRRRIEVVVPQELFPVLNEFPRVLKEK